eukprot:6001454-Karenia_brevis.AAC.1
MALVKLSSAGLSLDGSMESVGFGLPLLCTMFPQRVESVGLYGCEALASHKQRIKVVMKGFNEAAYLCVKHFLGVDTIFSLGGD